jgi:tetratricopeptide (TPR) repeat protein
MGNRYAMNIQNNKIKKPVKDQDLRTTTYFLRVAGLSVPFLCLLGLYIGYVYWGPTGAASGVVIAAVAGIVISIIIMYVMDAVSGAASGLLSGRREAVWTIREQVQGFLSQARFNKENENYPAALSYVNKVLEKDPDFAEALFLKAQVLWEGFGHSKAAIQFLEKILSLEDDNKMIQNQALMLHTDLKVLEHPPDNMTIPEGIEIGLRSQKSSIAQKLTHESFQGLKNRAEETPMAWWAIYAAVVLGLFLVCLLVNMHLQLQNLDRASTPLSHSVENTMAITQTHTDRIDKVEKSVQSLNTDLSRINKRLKNKK